MTDTTTDESLIILQPADHQGMRMKRNLRDLSEELLIETVK